MAKPSILEIAKRGDEYWFVLTPAGRPLISAAERACPVRVQPQALAAFCRNIKEAVEAANQHPLKPGINSEPFVEAGRGLFRTLLSDRDPLTRELLGILRRLRTPLLISTDDTSIFWELLFDDVRNEFLGLRFNVGRRLLMRGLPSSSPRQRENWRWLMIANPNPDEQEWNLPDTAREAEKLRDWLVHRNVKHMDYIEGNEASFDAVLGTLNRHEYDVIHYAGHTVKDRNTGEYALRLNGGRLFPASSIRNLVRGSPIVFLNGCWTGIAKGLGNAPGSAEGLTDAFLDAGAQLVLGSLFRAPDAGARAFAEKFYEVVLAGKAVGEAVRTARLHVKGKSEYGAAWACFVMYGDPCLRFNLREDALQPLLQTVHLTRTDFEPPCLRVIEQSVEYGARQGLIGTPHLFAAMVDGEDRRVRNCLREQGVSPEKLRDAFAEVFKGLGSTKRPSRLLLSDNAEEILKHAQTVARTKGRARISETDLIEGFVHKHGGATGEILRALGADVRKFLSELRSDTTKANQSGLRPPPAASSGATFAGVSQASLVEADYSPEAWDALVRAIDFARSSGSQMVGTPQLFYGMLQNPDGALAKSFRRFGIQLANRELGINGEGHTLVPMLGPQPLSDSVSQILALAKSNARVGQRQQVAERDLLVGFVQQGGGSVGQALQKRGLLIESLISDLFLDSGALNMSHVSTEVRLLIEKANDLRKEKVQGLIGRRHVFYAMLANEESLLCSCLDRLGQKESHLADLLYAELPANSSSELDVSSTALELAPSLAQIFYLAEVEAKKRQPALIGEAHLTLSLVKFGGADIQRFLAHRGVRLSQLISCLTALTG